jgi:putative Holliday junction resolvase
MAAPAPAPRSVLALDVGRRRIGLAGCDPLGLTVTPLPALRRGRFAADISLLAPLVQQRRIAALVVGLPLDSAQQPTEQALHCRRYGENGGPRTCAGRTGDPCPWPGGGRPGILN